jgi:type VI secretion system protein ImpM
VKNMSLEHPMQAPLPSRAVGFLGKLPARPDFVRHHLDERISAQLEQWLEAGSQSLLQAKAELPDGFLRFVFSAPGCDSIAIGVLANSRDTVGRSYPLAIFTTLPSAPLPIEYSALPSAYEAFFADATAVLARAGSLELEAMRERVRAILPPTAAALEAAVEHSRALLRHADAPELLARAFDGGLENTEFYALFTLCAATTVVRAGPPSAPPTVLDCPIGTSTDLTAWLELARRRLTWHRDCPSFIWTSGPSPRLLLALGFAPPQLLCFVVDPGHNGARLWPLTTQKTDAIARAYNLLAPGLEQRGDASVRSVDELWELVSKLTV